MTERNELDETTDLPCVVTNGGPLVVIARALADTWRGVLPPIGADVPEGWAWGDGGVVCDYDRACDPPAVRFHPHDGYALWSVTIAGGHALVLDGDCGTTALRWDDGIVFVRDFGAATEEEAIAVIAAIADNEWLDTKIDFEIGGDGLFVFDSAYAGFERENADGGVIEAELPSGIYRVAIAAPPDLDRTTLIRLTRTDRRAHDETQRSRGIAGVTIR